MSSGKIFWQGNRLLLKRQSYENVDPLPLHDYLGYADCWCTCDVTLPALLLGTLSLLLVQTSTSLQHLTTMH